MNATARAAGATSHPAAVTSWILGAGPVATVLATLWAWHVGSLAAIPPHIYLLVALLAWSPLPVSVPAVALDNYRDAFRPNSRGIDRVWRAFALPVWLASPSCPAFRQARASYMGFAVACVLAAPAIVASLTT